jgi:flagellar basal body-associated protein FliL
MSEDLMQGEDLDTQVASLQGKIKLLLGLLLVSFVMVLGVGGFAVTKIGSLEQELGDVKAVVAKRAAGVEKALPEMEASARHVGTIHPLGNFVVNLLDPGNVRYVNCRIEVEVEDSATVKEITARDALFKDAVISLLGNQTYEDLLGIEGKAQLREELIVRFNRMLPRGQIARVYITEFVVQ